MVAVKALYKAKLMVATAIEKLSLCAFGNIVENIAEKPADEVSIGTLLKAKPFKMIHVNGIIQSVSRKPYFSYSPCVYIISLYFL